MTNWFGLNPTFLIKKLSVGILVLWVSACSVPQATIQLGSSLSVFPVGTPFDLDNLPEDWFTRGVIPANRVGGSSHLIPSTVSLSSATVPYLVARRVKANLLATPYLSWRWWIEPGKWNFHPIRIVIGFSGGGTGPPHEGFISQMFPGSFVPAYDRVLSLLWAPSALMRGNLVALATDRKTLKEAHYTVRGGAENVAKWWSETVDLASLYKLSWPTDQTNTAQIVFIGVSSAASSQTYKAILSDLRLSR